MKILVTGGAGFIGSSVIRQAITDGHSIVNVDVITYAACLENTADVAGSASYHFEQADICDASEMARIFDTYNPDAVMHLAAESHVDRSIDGPGAFLHTNITGTYVLLEAARYYWEQNGRFEKFRFHHISTDEVYGTLGPTGQFTEQTPYDPRSPYSASKAASDHLVRAWGETYGLPIIVTNCSNNYGPYQFPEKLVPVTIINALAHNPLPIYGDGSNIRDWLYVEDHADALLTVLKNSRLQRTYNIGGNNECTNLKLVQLLCAELDRKRPRADGKRYAEQITFVNDRPGHDQRYAIDASLLKEDLGWMPSVNLSEGISRTVDWYLNHEEWWRPLLDRNGVGLRLGTV